MGLLDRIIKKKRTEAQQQHLGEIEDLLVKRCPECFVNLPLDAKECFSCHTKVGRPDRHGKARKRPDWISYVICIISWAIFFLYIEWAFLR
jgi:ribosomal protein L40E